MVRASESQTAIRNYLLYIEDPRKLVDQDELARLKKSAKSAADPLERLQAINRVQQIRNGETDIYRNAFCEHAKAWAQENDIRPASFLEVGVDEATLRAAGFSSRDIGRRPSSTRRPTRVRPEGQVRVEQVQEAARSMTRQFTLAEMASVTGGSPMTIRKAIDQMVATGEVERLGPTPNWATPDARRSSSARSTSGRAASPLRVRLFTALSAEVARSRHVPARRARIRYAPCLRMDRASLVYS